ncbi:MAG: hypothetical protein LN410_00210 [Candidatus Thermoplasmatota archaeon]|nr:hypothetical protein [Candidatus Thermoplasmatota archaeon]
MLSREVALSPADVERIAGNVSKLGGYALGLVEHFDLGIDRDLFQHHLMRTQDHVRTMVGSAGSVLVDLRPKGFSHQALFEATNLAWNYPQDLRFAAGSCMISRMYARWMSEDNLKRALVAKVLYACQEGILDDVIDKGPAGYLEAKDLYHLVLSSMTDPSLNPNAFMKRLMGGLGQEQLDLFETIVTITLHFNRLFHDSPHGGRLFYEMEKLEERAALGQALTMFQKEATLDIPKLASIARSFHAADGSLTWYERLASYIGGAARLNLIDAAFVDRRLRAGKLKTLLKGWSLYDTVIILLNTVGGIHQDLRDGLVNLSLVAMREKELRPLRTLQGFKPELTLDDYRTHIVRLANIASRGLEIVSPSYADPHQYFPFSAVMLPVVLLAEWIGKNDEMIHAYIEAAAPSIRRAAERSPRTRAPQAEETARRSRVRG